MDQRRRNAEDDAVLVLLDHAAPVGRRRLHAKAERILHDGVRVRGVQLADGETIEAPMVVSNLDPTTTFTRLLRGSLHRDRAQACLRGSLVCSPFSNLRRIIS